MKKKSIVIVSILILNLIIFASGLFIGLKLQNNESVVDQNYNTMYATIVESWSANNENVIHFYTVTRIKADSPVQWYEGNRYDIYVDENTRILWHGQEIPLEKLQNGDFVKITLQEETAFLETFPVSVTPAVVEIEYLGGNNYIQ